MTEQQIQILMLIMIVMINFGVWFMAGTLAARRPSNTINPKTYTKEEVRKQFINADPTEAEIMGEIDKYIYKDTKIYPIPVGELIDVIDSIGRIHRKVKLVRRNPIKFEPDFLRYKNIVSWKYSSKNA